MANFNKVVCELALERYKAKMSPSDAKSWNWIPRKLGKERAYVLFNDVWSFNSERVEALEPDLDKTVAEMKKIRRVVIATVRQSTEDTLNVLGWLHGQGIQPDGFASVNIRRLQKHELLNYDEIIDDGTPNLKAAIRLGKIAYIRDQSWNKSVKEGERSMRIRKLSEALDSMKYMDRHGRLPEMKSAEADLKSAARKIPKAKKAKQV